MQRRTLSIGYTVCLIGLAAVATYQQAGCKSTPPPAPVARPALVATAPTTTRPPSTAVPVPPGPGQYAATQASANGPRHSDDPVVRDTWATAVGCLGALTAEEQAALDRGVTIEAIAQCRWAASHPSSLEYVK